MKKPGKTDVSKRIVIYEALLFVFAIAIIWLDEIIDMPGSIVKATPTPINWKEALFESVIIILFGTMIIRMTMKLFYQMKSLEGILPICGSCKRIKDDKGSWHHIEVYIRDRSEAEFSHGLCPECETKFYPEFRSNKTVE
ncbi:hypothetical protein JXQ70_07910 [bacterium]|nr:hypothetical protein [bacterium]